MGLFGDDDEDHSKANLFGDEPRRVKERGLFGEQSDPWIPAAKQKVEPDRALAGAQIPEAYVEFFESYAENDLVSKASLAELLTDANLGEEDRQVLSTLALDHRTQQTGLSRSMFNVVLVLIALAQQGEELSMDAVDDRRLTKLPIPELATRKASVTTASKKSTSKTASTTEERLVQTTLNSYIGSAPAPGTSTKVNSSQSKNAASNGTKREALADPWSPVESASHTPQYERSENPEASTYNPHTPDSSYEPDSVSIRALDSKEGIPLWKHINYQVESTKRKSSVVRRYSEFAWLLECLLKKYPFRQVPLLPPKRLAGMNLTGKQADIVFLGKRRRGLARFVNALERHPVLRADQLVTTFLTVPTELAIWRKQATISIKEEFDDRYLSPDLEGSLPQGIEAWMLKTQLSLKGATESFNVLTQIQERLIRRQDAISADMLRYTSSLNTFCENESANFDILGNENGPGIVNGLRAVAKHHLSSRELVDKECQHQDANLLEDLKRQRDTLCAMHELFQRHARYSGDNIPALERRIASNQLKLSALNAKPEAKEADKVKLASSIETDHNTIVKLGERKVFIRECIWHELQYFTAQQIHISRLINEAASSRVAFAKKHVDICQILVGDVEGMPC